MSAKKRTRKSSFRFDTVVEAFPYPILTFDVNDKLEFANPACAPVLLRYDLENPGEVAPSALVQAFERVRGSGFAEKIEEWFGDLYLELMISAHPDGRIQITGRDLTPEKRMEEELEIARAQAAHATRIASLATMAGGVAHEINNPLAIISTKVELLLTKVHDPAVSDQEIRRVTQASAEKIAQHSQRIARIIKGLRAFARDPNAEPFESVPVSRIISDALELTQTSLENLGIELKIAPIPDDLVITCRQIGICQSIVNLMMNSRDAVRAMPEKWIEVKVIDQGSDVLFQVRDSGHGIPQDIQTRMFDPFFTSKAVNEGTGLGLSVVSGIISAHGGKLQYSDDSGHTEFRFALPKEPSLV
jgi:C4-dicarboxylate-specific signal transduction histidine kinase